jgi:hypothetical protein
MEHNQKELQKEVDQIYQYAANLMINEKRSAIDTKDELIRNGLRPEDASFIVDHIDEQIRKVKKKKASGYYVWGILSLVGGLVATIVSEGSHIFIGAILGGIALIGSGLSVE